ncbi:hypothetical protein T459_20071 [Capsicum annuum]|uniref:Ubiquitin-like protease family profile domain-containing protein n=1 Tax=Capsicum annuum TaxID=4072 RepID=A0A2G2Z3J2_CAPAN|nr:hypothetical protein T459_20071 [Capsicum annuum]
MKKLHQKLAKKEKKKESDTKKRESNSLASKAPAKRRRIVEEICRDELPKELSYVIKEIPTHPLRFLNASPILFSDFKMVQDGKYQFFSWGIASFSRLMASLRQEFSMEKQLYRLDGIPQVLNMWIFELYSNVDTKVAVKEDTEEKCKVDADSTSINMKELLIKADLHSLESEMKTYVKTYIDQKFKDLKRMMNDRFTEVLKSMHQKNQTVKQDVGIENQSVIVVEEMQPFENAAKDLATQDASARTDEVDDMEMSLINTIKVWSTRAGRPWDMVNEVFVPISFDGVFHWVLTVIALKDRCIRVYDSMASSRKKYKQVRLKSWT